MKLANLRLDIFDDVGLGVLQKIAANLPEDVKKQSVMSFEEREALDDTDFALQIITKEASQINKYPVNDAFNTRLSSEYFNEIGSQLPYGAQKIAAHFIKSACERFGIEPSERVVELGQTPAEANVYVEGCPTSYEHLLKQAEAEYEKTPHIADSPHFYALPQLKKYAMPNQEYVKKAATYFEKFSSHFDTIERREYAVEVKERAKELHVDMKEFPKVAQYSSNVYNDNLEGHLATRKHHLVNKPEYCDMLDKMASVRKDFTPDAFARALYEFDKRAGLTQYYDTGIADAYFSTFGLEKEAHDSYEVDNMIVTGRQLKGMSDKQYKKVAEYFGPTIANGVKKDNQIFQSLDDSAKEVIARIMHGQL